MEKKDPKSIIIQTLSVKARLKQQVFDKTFSVFNQAKEVLQEITNEYNAGLKGIDKRILLEYKDRGKFEAQIKIAGDILVFSMHSNIFEFDRGHVVWKTSYAQKDKTNTYCGIINIYNFLSDSFKYNRNDDLGYLIARVFVNKEMYYFVEGKRQFGFLYSNFGKEKITREIIKKIINTAIVYALQFDLLVPPYDNVKIASVGLMNKKIQSTQLQTGKRVGFQFNSDDVSGEK